MRDNSLPIYETGKCTFFALGRNAIYAACQVLKLKPQDEVLTPAFDCDATLQPFNVLGLKLRFVRSYADDFSVDIDDLKRQISPKTKLIHIINHFGMPQPWDEILTLRKQLDIPILEDNAYSLFSKFNGRLLGTFGDFSIFSLRKNLPLVDGGLLRVNNPKYTLQLTKKNTSLFSLSEMPTMLKIIKDGLKFYKIPQSLRKIKKIIWPVIMPPPPLYSEEKDGYPYWSLRDSTGKEFSCDYLRPMSWFSKSQLSRFNQDDFTTIAKKKRYYCKLLSDRLRNVKGIKILWPELPDGAVPFCLSLLVCSAKRDLILESLQKRYYVMAWPTLSRQVLIQLDNFPEIQLLGRKLLQICLPAEKVRLASFPRYLENLLGDLFRLLNR